MIEERDISVAMRDGTRLAVDVYRPAPDSRARRSFQLDVAPYVLALGDLLAARLGVRRPARSVS